MNFLSRLLLLTHSSMEPPPPHLLASLLASNKGYIKPSIPNIQNLLLLLLLLLHEVYCLHSWFLLLSQLRLCSTSSIATPPPPPSTFFLRFTPLVPGENNGGRTRPNQMSRVYEVGWRTVGEGRRVRPLGWDLKGLFGLAWVGWVSSKALFNLFFKLEG
ncbi:unnamed protein product [Arctogadus glacialis]